MRLQAGQYYLVISHNQVFGKLRKHVAKINEVDPWLCADEKCPF